MSKAKTPTKKEQTAPVEVAASRRWYFPTLGKSVEAASQSEAEKLVHEQVTQGSAQEEGDGNI